MMSPTLDYRCHKRNHESSVADLGLAWDELGSQTPNRIGTARLIPSERRAIDVPIWRSLRFGSIRSLLGKARLTATKIGRWVVKSEIPNPAESLSMRGRVLEAIGSHMLAGIRRVTKSALFSLGFYVVIKQTRISDMVGLLQKLRPVDCGIDLIRIGGSGTGGI